jgi:MoxR-like ATPase
MSSTQIQNQIPDKVNEAKIKIENVRQALYRIVIGHEEAIDAAILALIAREHIVIVGPPGTAKTMLATSVSKLLNAQCYTYLMTRFTVFDELFGPIDVSALARGELKRRWSNIISADIVFLDEIFKASSAILNSLLSLMQERVVYDPMTGQPIQTRLWTLIAASNEVPSDEELQALYDRFAVRVFVQYLDDDAKLLSALIARWQTNGAIQPLASMEDVKALHEHAIALLSREKDIIKFYHINVVPLIKTLRAKGIIISDRKVIEKLSELYAAYLTLHGVTPDNIINAAYDIIVFAAHSPQEAAEIRKTKVSARWRS